MVIAPPKVGQRIARDGEKPGTGIGELAEGFAIVYVIEHYGEASAIW
jgi:hypothetical protein